MDGFVYQKVTQKIKSKKQKELELEKKRNEENVEKGKSERLNIQKQVKLRFDPKLGFELTLKDCDTIIAEIKPDTPFSINEKDISILCQRVESLRKRYGKYRTLRELFDLEKKNTSNNRGKKEKVVRKCHREPEQNIIGKKLGREGIRNDLDFGGKRKYCGTYDKGSAKEISNQEIDRAFFKIYGTGQKEKNCFSINQRNQVVLYRDEIIKMIDIDSIASEKTVFIKKFLLKKAAAEEKKLQARLRKAERKKQKREIEREKRNIHHDPVLAGKREKLKQERKEAKIEEQYNLKRWMWGSSF